AQLFLIGRCFPWEKHLRGLGPHSTINYLPLRQYQSIFVSVLLLISSYHQNGRNSTYHSWSYMIPNNGQASPCRVFVVQEFQNHPQNFLPCSFLSCPADQHQPGCLL